MNWNGFEGRGEDEGGRRRGRGARPGGWQNVDLPPADDAQSWFEGRLPDGWFSTVDVTVDREEITVLGSLPDEGVEGSAAEGRIGRFRADTRERRIEIAELVEKDSDNLAFQAGVRQVGQRPAGKR